MSTRAGPIGRRLGLAGLAGLAGVAGATTALAFAPWKIIVMALAGPALALWSFRRCDRPWAGAGAGLAYGLAFTFLAYHWMLELDLVAYVVLSVLQAGFWAILGAVAAWAARLGSARWLVIVVATWTLIEGARARFPISGFEWGQLGLSTAGTVLRRGAAVVGTLGLTGLLVAVAAALVVVAWDRTARSAVPLAASGIAVAVVTALGALSWTTPGGTLQVALVQADVPCPGAFAQDCPGYTDVLLDTYVARTSALDAVPDLVLWGEDALRSGETLEQVGERFVADFGPLPAPLLAGTATPAGPGRFLRWAALFDVDGTALDGYAKRRPVPFGEYVPLRSVLGGISDVGRLVPSDLVPGTDSAPVALPVNGDTVRLGTVVSWEVTFSRLVRDVAAEADGLATLTTVSSYGTTAASDQLLGTAQLRAAELQKPMAVAATTGRSAVISPTGEITVETGLLTADDVIGEMSLRGGLTPFGRTGDVPVVVLALGAVLLAAAGRRRALKPGDDHRVATPGEHEAHDREARDRETDPSAAR